MKTYAQFKSENNLEGKKLEFVQGKGRAFAKVNDKSLFVSEKFNPANPAYVTELRKPIDAALPISDDNSVVIPNAFVLCNAANLKTAFELQYYKERGNSLSLFKS